MSQDQWRASACILCELNCGIKVQTGGRDDREIVSICGDEVHPSSKGYLCQKASGLNHHLNDKDRVTSLLRGRQDGTRSGIAPNELTSLADRDKFAGTPHHKCVPARIEAAREHA